MLKRDEIRKHTGAPGYQEDLVEAGEAGGATTEIATYRHGKRLGDILIREGLITSDQLSQALEIQKKERKKLGTILIKLGFVTNDQIIKSLGQQLNIQAIDLSQAEIPSEVLNLLPPKIITRYRSVPVKVEGNKLFVAMQDPLDYFAIEDIGLISGYHVVPLIALEDDIQKIIYEHYGAKQVAEQVISEVKFGVEEAPQEEEEASLDDAPVVKLVNSILESAIREKASDIHIEPSEDQMMVRLRIDGILHKTVDIPKRIQNPVLSRIKLMANMDIAEKRVPQDGRIQMVISGREIDMRVNSMPTIFGETLCLRMLDKKASLIPLAQLGLLPDEEEKLRRLIRTPNGIILITGPTGSGKTTTLYSLLKEVNEPVRHIITVEDPVEYQLRGINQVQINNRAGMTFAATLRAILRQDPNVIMVGEIRDRETAEIAIDAALTGHLVLSTLHTNDAPSSVTRMSHMGVEPFLISAAVIGVVAQRLARTICTSCAVDDAITDRHRLLLSPYIKDGQQVQVKKGQGCKVCHDTGYRGRIGVYEIMMMSSLIKESIVKGMTTDELRKISIQEGMDTLEANGFKKVLMGHTSIEEIQRVAKSG